MVDQEINELIQLLELEAHPEGGYYRETYRADLRMEAQELGMEGLRNVCTAIYFLLTSENFSAFHRIRSDELWHFYKGDPLHIHEIDEEGQYTVHKLSGELDKGQPQCVIRAGSWFASEVASGGAYALVGCTVSPGFDFTDFEMADRSLIKHYPEHQDLLSRLIR